MNGKIFCSFAICCFGLFLLSCTSDRLISVQRTPTIQNPVSTPYLTSDVTPSATFVEDNIISIPTVLATNTPLTDPSLIPKTRGDSFSPDLSNDGRYVVYTSRATDLYPGPTGECTGPDGNEVACAQIILYDRETTQNTLVSLSSVGESANGNCSNPMISGDGRWIVFVSTATNLVEGDKTDDSAIYLVDRENATIRMVHEAGMQPAISGDGRFITFTAVNSDVWKIVLYDRTTDQSVTVTEGLAGESADGSSEAAQISADGNWVAFISWAGNLVNEDKEVCRPGERVNYSCGDLFIYHRESDQVQRIPLAEPYGIGMGDYRLSLSADGESLAFGDTLFSLPVGEKQPLCGLTDPRCSGGLLSDDGNKVAFTSGADVFVHDRNLDRLSLISVTSDGIPANGALVDFINNYEGETFYPGVSLSSDGNWIVFSSTATHLLPTKFAPCIDGFFGTHDCYNIFLHDLQTASTAWISKPIDGDSK